MQITPGAMLGEFEQICVGMSVSGAVIAVRQLAGLRCTVSFGAAPAVGSRLAGESAFTKRCVETGEVVLCDDAASDPMIGPLAAARLGFRSAVAVPIEAQRSVVGLIEVFCPEPSAISAASVAALQRVAKSFASLMMFDAANGGEPVVGGSIEEPIVLPTLATHQESPTTEGPRLQVAEEADRNEGVERSENRDVSQPRVPQRIATLAQLPSDRPTPSRVWLIAGALCFAVLLLLLFLYMTGARRQEAPVESSACVAREGRTVLYTLRHESTCLGDAEENGT